MDRKVDNLNQHFLLSDLVNNPVLQTKPRRSAAFVTTGQGLVMKAFDAPQTLWL